MNEVKKMQCMAGEKMGADFSLQNGVPSLGLGDYNLSFNPFADGSWFKGLSIGKKPTDAPNYWPYIAAGAGVLVLVYLMKRK